MYIKYIIYHIFLYIYILLLSQCRCSHSLITDEASYSSTLLHYAVIILRMYTNFPVFLRSRAPARIVQQLKFLEAYSFYTNEFKGRNGPPAKLLGNQLILLWA